MVGGLFVLAGATPAALGLLADMSEPYPRDRGAIMGLYSVFLAVGQIIGSLAGGVAADARGIDGLLVVTLVFLAVAAPAALAASCVRARRRGGGGLRVTSEGLAGRTGAAV